MKGCNTLLSVSLALLRCSSSCNDFEAPRPVHTHPLPPQVGGTCSRRQSFTKVLGTAAICTLPAKYCLAFEGGVGGLGKTKPETGVTFISGITPSQDSKGLVSAELVGPLEQPILVEFKSPWPLLPSTSGLETRDLRGTESAFVQVATLDGNQKANWKSKVEFSSILNDSLLASQGKFGAYGSPVDVKLKPLPNESSDADGDARFNVKFTSFTPSMLESERQLSIRARQVDSVLVMLVAGTTKTRFASQEAAFDKLLDSFQVVAAPRTRLR